MKKTYMKLLLYKKTAIKNKIQQYHFFYKKY